MSIGREADLARVIETIADLVDDAGGHKIAKMIEAKRSLRRATT